MKTKLLIGIDPGVNTGVAVTENGRLRLITSMQAVAAEDYVLGTAKDFDVHVYVEDTRNLRLPRSMQSQHREKGVGGVHRDMGRWQEFLTFHNIPHTMTGLSPKPFRVNDGAWFNKITGWTQRTNEHGRAAAGLIWGR